MGSTPSRITVDVTEEVRVTGAGGGGGNANITQVAGNPISATPAAALPVELFDGTNPFGTSSNPLSDNVAQWGATAVAAATATPAGTENAPVVRNLPGRIGGVITTTPTTINSSTYYPGGVTVPTSANWYDTNAQGAVYAQITVYCPTMQFNGANNMYIEVADNPNDTTVGTASCFALAGPISSLASSPSTIAAYITKRYWRFRYQTATVAPVAFQISYTATSVVPLPLNPAGSLYVSNALGDGSNNGFFDSNWPTAVSKSINLGGGTVLFGGVALCTTTPNSATAMVGLRTPNIFKSVQATSSGNTAVWTPTSGKKFRLMRVKIQVTANSTIAAGGVVTIGFQDATTNLNISHDVYVPAAGGTTLNGGYDSDWLTLDNGILSALANNVLNVNLSAALTAGNVRVIACGTEE